MQFTTKTIKILKLKDKTLYKTSIDSGESIFVKNWISPINDAIMTSQLKYNTIITASQHKIKSI